MTNAIRRTCFAIPRIILTLGILASILRAIFGDDNYTGNHPVGTGTRVAIISQG